MSSTLPRTIYVDVDDTLVRAIGKRVPMPAVIAAVRRTGGADYCRETAAALAWPTASWAF